MIAKPSQEHLLGQLSFRDTLILSAIYSECGEWGGHREMIKVYHVEEDYDNFDKWKKEPLTAAWFLDTIGCSKPNASFFLANQHLISIDDESAILEYMQTVLAYSLKERYPSHAGNAYLVAATRDNLRIYFWDTQYTWDGFQPLRHRLFKKEVKYKLRNR